MSGVQSVYPNTSVNVLCSRAMQDLHALVGTEREREREGGRERERREKLCVTVQIL
jgi:hypothetical protein